MINQKKFRKLLLVVVFLSSIFVLLTPWLVKDEVLGLKEEFWETIIILFFLTLIYAAAFLYFKEFRRLLIYQENLEERLKETFKYIGSVNLQIDEIKKTFSNFKKYPENRKEIEEVFNYFSQKILSLVNADWVVLKVINIENNQTLKTTKFVRGKKDFLVPEIKNDDILAGECYLHNCSIIKSEQENLKIKASCILPIKIKNNEEKFFIQSLINQLEMMFLVYSSYFYNKNKK